VRGRSTLGLRQLTPSPILASVWPRRGIQAYDAERRGPTAKLIRRSRQIGNLGQLDSRFAVGLRETGLRAFGSILKLTKLCKAGKS